MTNQRYSPEFKDEAVRQVVDRGHSVDEASERLGVSAHSLYKWVKTVKPDKSEQQASELIEAKSEALKLRTQLRRTEEEHDILKKTALTHRFQVDGLVHVLERTWLIARCAYEECVAGRGRLWIRNREFEPCDYRWQAAMGVPGGLRQAADYPPPSYE